jgi:hypothetical protein
VHAGRRTSTTTRKHGQLGPSCWSPTASLCALHSDPLAFQFRNVSCWQHRPQPDVTSRDRGQLRSGAPTIPRATLGPGGGSSRPPHLTLNNTRSHPILRLRARRSTIAAKAICWRDRAAGGSVHPFVNSKLYRKKTSPVYGTVSVCTAAASSLPPQD